MKIFAYPIFLGINSPKDYETDEDYDLCDHAAALIYIKENGEEAIFISDSLKWEHHHFKNFLTLMKEKKIPIYAYLLSRQKNSFGCINDAIVAARDLCRKNLEGEWYIPNFLSFLNAHSHFIASYSFFEVTKLPKTFARMITNPELSLSNNNDSFRFKVSLLLNLLKDMNEKFYVKKKIILKH